MQNESFRETALTQLANLAGIVPSYEDVTGQIQVASEETRRALLHALGFEVETDSQARDSLCRFDESRRRRLLPPAIVAPPSRGSVIPVRLHGWRDGDVDCSFRLLLEDGSKTTGDALLHVRNGRASLHIGRTLPLGYHRIEMNVGDRTASCKLILAPRRCPSLASFLGKKNTCFGIQANLYTLKTGRGSGTADLTDLKSLLRLAAHWKASFVGINPLHALTNKGGDISPYRPLSRLFLNTIYIDLEAVPEFAHSPAARTLFAKAEARMSDLSRMPHVPYEEVAALRQPILRALYESFRESQGARNGAFRRFTAEAGGYLSHHALFLAILDRHGPFHRWPEELQDARSASVAKFLRQHPNDVEFHRYLAFEADRQLGEAASSARAQRMRFGIYGDLAIGSSPDGSDVWGSPELFVRDASIGAPPDPLGPEGQNWGLPPIHPVRLRNDGYDFFTRLIRFNLRHRRLLRLDHVMGLWRQFLIPKGMSGEEGAYLSYPASDLLGILALEAARAAALIVGEDLGTVPPGLREELLKRGLLSTKVLYFERDPDGSFRASRRYPRHSMATINTHDLVPLHGYLTGKDVEVRQQAGLIDEPQELARQRGARRRDIDFLSHRLTVEHKLDDDPTTKRLVVACHAHVASSRAALFGVSLDDLASEETPVNVPGLAREQYPSWSRRMSLGIEEIASDPLANEIMETVAKCRPGQGTRPIQS